MPCLSPRECALEQAAARRRARRERLFGIDVLAGGDRLFQRADALLGCRRVEEDRMIRARQRKIEIRRPVREPVRACGRGDAVGIAANKKQARQQALVPEPEAAFIDDRDERVGQMLRRADPPGCAVDDDSDRLLRHRPLP
jgi:hypothetical protein